MMFCFLRKKRDSGSSTVITGVLVGLIAIYTYSLGIIADEINLERDAEAGFEAFSGGLYRYAQENCAGCHLEDQAPFFASDNPMEAYEQARGYINFESIGDSIFLERVTNGHCGRNCRTDGRDMLGLLSEWANAEFPEPEDPLPPQEYISDAQMLPRDLPSGDEFLTLRWQMPIPESPGSETIVDGVVFEIEVQSFGEDALLIRRPRLGTQNVPILVKGITVLVNGRTKLSQQRFGNVNVVVEPTEREPAKSMEPGLMGFPVLSGRSELVLRGTEATNLIQVAFSEIHPMPQIRSCQNLPGFETQVMDLMVGRNCVFCHRSEQPRWIEAKLRFNMDSDVEELCAETLQRVDFEEPRLSPLILYALGQEGVHARAISFPEEIFPSWTDWVESERRE